ncbi:MAG: RNA polymerase sigma factor [Symploca sp. SIO2B6]|nr:RNA polymerase sigma factor [Symploca sp. SIO2B6]
MGNQLQNNGTDFWKLWVQYQDYLYQRCLSWMKGNSTDAEELLSQASVKAWEKWQNYTGTITNPRAWVTQLTYNLCRDIHRKRGIEAKLIQTMKTIAMTEDKYFASSVSSSGLAVFEHESKSHVRHAINALPARVRIPFLLRYDQEISYSEIAQKLTLSQEKVRKRVQQARTILRKELNKYFSDFHDSSVVSTCQNHPWKKERGKKERGKEEEGERKLSIKTQFSINIQEYRKNDSTLVKGQLSNEFMKLSWKKLLSKEIMTSGEETTITAGAVPASIDYKVTATCLEALSCAWYNSPSCLRWR